MSRREISPDRHQKSSVQMLSLKDRKYTIIITAHLPIKSFPDSFFLSHPCLHNESDAMVTVAKQQASQMLLILCCWQWAVTIGRGRWEKKWLGEGWMCMNVCVRVFINTLRAAGLYMQQLWLNNCNDFSTSARWKWKSQDMRFAFICASPWQTSPPIAASPPSLWLCFFFLFLICQTQMNYLVSHKQWAEIRQTVLLHFQVKDDTFHDAVKSINEEMNSVFFYVCIFKTKNVFFLNS